MSNRNAMLIEKMVNLDQLRNEREKILSNLRQIENEILHVPLGDIGDALERLEELVSQQKEQKLLLSKIVLEIEELSPRVDGALCIERALHSNENQD